MGQPIVYSQPDETSNVIGPGLVVVTNSLVVPAALTGGMRVEIFAHDVDPKVARAHYVFYVTLSLGAVVGFGVTYSYEHVTWTGALGTVDFAIVDANLAASFTAPAGTTDVATVLRMVET